MAKHLGLESGFIDQLTEIDDLVDFQLEVLIGLAQMDAEAEQAFLIVAEAVDRRDLSDKLREFAGEHRRHVLAIGEFLEKRAYEGGIADPEASSFVALSGAMAILSTRAGIAALRACEYFTNSAYEAALETVNDQEAHRLIERILADEQRHAQWLASHEHDDWRTVVGVFGNSVAGKA
jgi:rubrerythrin